MQQLHPRAVWLFFLGFAIKWSFFLIIFSFWGGSILLSIKTGGDVQPQDVKNILAVGILFVLLFLIAFIIFLFLWAKLTYNFYRYEVREDGFRKELGVIWKHYVTIPYDRIQNVDIYRGLLDRILGLSDLQIQTAGFSGGFGGRFGKGTEGRLPGLDPQTAEQLRDELVRRARGAKSQGL